MAICRTTCENCGRTFEYTISAKGGRPRAFCDDDCKSFKLALNVIYGLFALMRDRFTAYAWLMLRGELWAFLNARPWNRGVKKADAAARTSIASPSSRFIG